LIDIVDARLPLVKISGNSAKVRKVVAWQLKSLSNDLGHAQSVAMKTSTVIAKKSARPRHARRVMSVSYPPKPSKRAIAEAWARSAGIVSTGIGDLSTREGFGD
jgi:hypothetical protein